MRLQYNWHEVMIFSSYFSLGHPFIWLYLTFSLLPPPLQKDTVYRGKKMESQRSKRKPHPPLPTRTGPSCTPQRPSKRPGCEMTLTKKQTKPKQNTKRLPANDRTRGPSSQARLKKTGKVRWSCRHTSILHLKISLSLSLSHFSHTA